MEKRGKEIQLRYSTLRPIRIRSSSECDIWFYSSRKMGDYVLVKITLRVSNKQASLKAKCLFREKRR